MKTAGDPVEAVYDRRPERESAVPRARDAAGVASDSVVAPKANRPDVAPAPAGSLHDFLAELLAEQNRLDTPVVRASHAYERSKIQSPKSKIFESLIPLTRPRAGEQYAFEVDLDSCTGCKACVSACHALNGLDENETWRDTGQLLSCASASPVVQTITTACHHCADPACLNGCPVLAYEKDPLTGIVRHLDDQCIGCQYCILKCPYDVPKYNARLGIVRKCDLCHQRLAHGEAPACAQACPTQAIRVVVVTTRTGRLEAATAIRESALAVDRSGGSVAEKSEIRNPKSKIPFPGPDPAYTRPTTRYLSARRFPSDMRAADATALRPQPAHWPLVLMLTLLPWAIGLQALLLTPLREIASQPAAPPVLWAVVRAPGELVTYYVTNPAGQLVLFPLVLGALGLAAATFHLGQPLRAWRVFLGLRTSWFSREAVLFGAWFGLTGLAAFFPRVTALTALAAGAGLAALACSVMIYVDTRRSLWRAASTAPRFVLGGVLLACGSIDFATPVSAAGGNITYYVKSIIVLLLAGKLAVELASLRAESASARLQRGPLFGVLCVRLGLAAGAVVVFAFTAPAAAEPDLAYHVRLAAALVLLLAGEIAERYLFFRAVDAPKMPGYAS